MDEPRDQVCVDDLLNGRALLLREQPPEANGGKDHLHVIWIVDELEKFLEVRDLEMCQFVTKLTLNAMRCAINMKSSRRICSAWMSACSTESSINDSS